MNDQFKSDLQTLLDYYWQDELRDYEECEQPKGHIFVLMQRLQREIKK